MLCIHYSIVIIFLNGKKTCEERELTMKDEYVVHFWCVQQLWSMLCMSMLARKTRKTQQYKITIARNTLITKKLWQQEDDEDAVVVAADDDDDAIIDYQQMCFVMVSSHVVLSRLGTIILDNFSLALFFFLRFRHYYTDHENYCDESLLCVQFFIIKEPWTSIVRKFIIQLIPL